MNKEIISRNSQKYLILLLILFLSLLINHLLSYYPMSTKVEIPTIRELSIVFWVLLFIVSLITLLISIRTGSPVMALFMGVVYFFIFYSINISFRIIPEQSDVSSSGTYLQYLFSNEYFDSSIIPYFEYPVFFNLTSIIHRFMDLNEYDTINVGFFIILLSIPLALSIMVHRKISNGNPRIYYIFPATFIILTFYFLNSQFIQQFVGYFFLICLTGAYIQLRDTNNIIFYYLTIFFFIICIFSHPFMFIFFIFGLFYMKIFNLMKNPYKGTSSVLSYYLNRSPLEIFRYDLYEKYRKKENIYQIITERTEKVKKIFSGKKQVNDVSFGLIMLIYIIAYYNGFYRMNFFGDIINPVEGRGETWSLVASLLGSKETVGLISLQTYPLYDMVPKWGYLISRYLSFAVLFSVIGILLLNIIKISIKKINFVDVFVAMGSFIFLIAGFVNSAFLGQRSLQATFMGTSKYTLIDRKKSKNIAKIAFIIFIIAPLVFTLNMLVLNGISGNRFVEDNSTLSSGEFLEVNGIRNTTIVSTDRSFYPHSPLVPNPEEDFQRSGPGRILDPSYNIGEIHLYMYSDKLLNGFKYYGVDLNEYTDGQSIVYDQGDSRIVLNNNLRT